MTNSSKYKLILFDLDGTLCDRDSSVPLPGVVEWFGRCKIIGTQEVAICTNQGGVGFRHQAESQHWKGDFSKYPTKAQVEERFARLAEWLPPMPVDIWVCFLYKNKNGVYSPVPDGVSDHDPRWLPQYRKPEPGMLIGAMEGAGVTKCDTLMVGDSADDEGAAKAAGCDFAWAWEFFGWTAPEQKQVVTS